MAKRLAWLLIAACLTFTACTTTEPQKNDPASKTESEIKKEKDKDKGQQNSDSGIKFTKTHVPLKEIKRENDQITSTSVYTYGQDKFNPERIEIYNIHNELVELVVYLDPLRVELVLSICIDRCGGDLIVLFLYLFKRDMGLGELYAGIRTLLLLILVFFFFYL